MHESRLKTEFSFSKLARNGLILVVRTCNTHERCKTKKASDSTLKELKKISNDNSEAKKNFEFLHRDEKLRVLSSYYKSFQS